MLIDGYKRLLYVKDEELLKDYILHQNDNVMIFRCIDETLDEMSLYNEKNIEFIKKYNSDDEIYLEGDYNRLKQVLVNIIKK